MRTVIFAAHPDDAEIGMAGTIAKMCKDGRDVILCDMTRGEMGTRGSMEERMREAENSAEILGIKKRINLGLPDGGLKINDSHIKKAVEVIREYRPKIIFAPYLNDRHPDHIGAAEIVKRAYFFCGAGKYSTEIRGSAQTSYRPSKLFYYSLSYDFEPSFIIDISEFIDTKIKAIQAFGTQFYNPESSGEQTLISSKMFLEYIKSRARVNGFKIRKDFGEAFFTEENIELNVESVFYQGA